MAADDRPPIPPEELLRVNRVLDEQVKTLVKTEQRLFQSQRALARRNARLDALNRLALEAVELSDPRELLARAAEVLFSVFALDQAVGFLATSSDAFVPVFARGAEGERRDLRVALVAARDQLAIAHLPQEPQVDSIGALRERPELAPLFGCIDRIFADPSSPPLSDPAAPAVVVPLSREGGKAVGVLVFVRLSATASYHEELPTAGDLGFIGVVARLVAAGVTNLRLVQDLKVSYDRLAKAQRDLVDRERLAALGEFSAIVAHEVRNPLGVIFNAVAMLRRQLAGSPSSPLLDIVGEESQRLDRIVVDLIDFARPNPALLRPEHLQRVVESALESVRTALPSAQVSIVSGPDTPEVLADARLLRQAIFNLVLNAVQSSRDGGPIVVRLGSDAHGRAHIAVEDRGAGVPAELAERIFEPFFTTKATGTGLGLSVVKRVAETHHGSIEVASRLEGGSVFTLSLPIAEAR